MDVEMFSAYNDSLSNVLNNLKELLELNSNNLSQMGIPEVVPEVNAYTYRAVYNRLVKEYGAKAVNEKVKKLFY